MSMDLKVLECAVFKIDTKPEPAYRFIDYVQVPVSDGSRDCWNYIKNKGYKLPVVSEEDSTTLLGQMYWDSYIFDKDALKDLLLKYANSCTLKEELLKIIEGMIYQYIILQRF